MKSNFLSLNARDFIKAIVMVFISALLTGFYQLLQGGAAFNWVTLKPVVLSSVAAVVAYLLKNFFTNSDDKFLKNEPPQATTPPPTQGS